MYKSSVLLRTQYETIILKILFYIDLVCRYEKMDVFKSFRMHFITCETDNLMSSYVSVKFEKTKRKPNFGIPHIDRTTSGIKNI